MKNSPMHRIFGKHPVKMALKNSARKHKNLYITKNSLKEFEKIIKNCEVNVLLTEPRVISDKLKGENHQGVLLESQLNEQIDIEDVIYEKNDKSRILILDQITDVHNIGAITRAAVAFGVDHVITAEKHSPSDYGVIAKSSAGNCELLNIVTVTNLADAIKGLKDNGFWVVGMDGSAQKSVSQVNKSLFDGKSAIIMGSENKGMRRLTRQLCDEIAKINISNRVESLNVANACSIALYEFYG